MKYLSKDSCLGCGVFNFDEVSLHHIYTYIHTYIILYYIILCKRYNKYSSIHDNTIHLLQYKNSKDVLELAH